MLKNFYIYQNKETNTCDIYVPNMAICRKLAAKYNLEYEYYSKWAPCPINEKYLAPTLKLCQVSQSVKDSLVQQLKTKGFRLVDYDDFKYTDKYNGTYKEHLEHCYLVKLKLWFDNSEYLELYKNRNAEVNVLSSSLSTIRLPNRHDLKEMILLDSLFQNQFVLVAAVLAISLIIFPILIHVTADYYRESIIHIYDYFQ
ncbi:hypothetical protein SAMN05660706_11417 [Desulfoscipio geothermicus DSM 3669]|uniref:Uncharacterized protein n=2 Tax=Desulfoscipio geothermicus TaxID=39060 RepID=A0A1I6DNG7_9FIRM|nr:hypothetical protein SAMN05660706_11417 [Desulfoscipio geothermicus DSM 3669]